MPSFSEHFSGVSLSGRRLMGLDAGVQPFGHLLDCRCHMWPLLWTGELQARIAFLSLSELYRASPLTHTGQAPRTGCQLLGFHLRGFTRFPLRHIEKETTNHPSLPASVFSARAH